MAHGGEWGTKRRCWRGKKDKANIWSGVIAVAGRGAQVNVAREA